MSFFPILRIPDFEGSVTLHNYSPNNFESSRAVRRYAYVGWADGESWNYQQVGTLEPGDSLKISESMINGIIPNNCLPVAFLSRDTLSIRSSSIGEVDTPSSSLPAWRATIELGFRNRSKSTYQGEIDPFPQHGSCLTFNYLSQFHDDVETWLIALSLIESPLLQPAEIHFYDPSKSDEPLHREIMHTNGTNSFLLPRDIARNENIAIICIGASFIPIFFSCNQERTQLSLEHTHPPASTAIYGDRIKAQRLIKSNWFARLFR